MTVRSVQSSCPGRHTALRCDYLIRAGAKGQTRHHARWNRNARAELGTSLAPGTRRRRANGSAARRGRMRAPAARCPIEQPLPRGPWQEAPGRGEVQPPGDPPEWSMWCARVGALGAGGVRYGPIRSCTTEYTVLYYTVLRSVLYGPVRDGPDERGGYEMTVSMGSARVGRVVRDGDALDRHRADGLEAQSRGKLCQDPKHVCWASSDRTRGNLSPLMHGQHPVSHSRAWIDWGGWCMMGSKHLLVGGSRRREELITEGGVYT